MYVKAEGWETLLVDNFGPLAGEDSLTPIPSYEDAPAGTSVADMESFQVDHIIVSRGGRLSPPSGGLLLSKRIDVMASSFVQGDAFAIDALQINVAGTIEGESTVVIRDSLNSRSGTDPDEFMWRAGPLSHRWSSGENEPGYQFPRCSSQELLDTFEVTMSRPHVDTFEVERATEFMKDGDLTTFVRTYRS